MNHVKKSILEIAKAIKQIDPDTLSPEQKQRAMAFARATVKLKRGKAKGKIFRAKKKKAKGAANRFLRLLE